MKMQPGKNGRYPLVNKQFAIENGPVKIVDLPSNKKWWIFP
jgi:hypothetical protein